MPIELTLRIGTSTRFPVRVTGISDTGRIYAVNQRSVRYRHSQLTLAGTCRALRASLMLVLIFLINPSSNFFP